MARLPFPNGFEGTENLPKTNKILQNCFNNGEGQIISRPGIQLLKTTGKVARGQFEWNDSLYQVVSGDLIKITNVSTGAFSVIGTIAGTDPIETDVGFNDAVIVVRGGNSYSLSKADVLTDTSANSNFKPFVDVTHFNGRFVYLPEDGTPVRFSDVGAAGTIQAASFFDAERRPDKNKAVFALNDALYIMGEDLIEPFRDTGADPNPFTRIPGASIQNGFIGGLLEYNDTFIFIGRKSGQGIGIFAIGQGRAPRISNERIDLLLSTYTEQELSEAIPGRIIWRGYDIATFALRRDSFGFFNGNWFILDTIFDGISRPWGGGYITEFQGEYYTAFEDKIGKFAKINTDYGGRTTKRIGFGLQDDQGNFRTVQSIELGLSQGFNPDVGSVALRMTRNNVQFGPEKYINLGAIGKYADKLKWNPPGGLGVYDGFFGIEIVTTEDVDFSANYLLADIR